MRVKLMLSIAFIFISVFVLSAQNKEHIISLLPSEKKISAPFFCDSIVDNRIIKTNIGMVGKLFNNIDSPAYLDGSFNETLKNNINKDLLLPNSDSAGLIFIVHVFNIFKRINPASQTAICRIEIEFAKMQGDELYSLGSYYSITEKTILNSPSYYSTIIRSCLLNCIRGFINEGHTNKELSLIENTVGEHVPFDLSMLPETAYYSTFYEMRNNKPIDYFRASFNIINKGQSMEHFRVKAKEKKDRKNFIGYLKHKDDLYIHSTFYTSGNYFIKAKQLGRFIYFEDRYSNSVAAAAAFGLAGYAATNTKKSLVLDSDTGILEIVKPDMVPSFIVKYPEIKDYWLSSKMKHSDIEEVFIMLNEELKEE